MSEVARRLGRDPADLAAEIDTIRWSDAVEHGESAS